MKKSEQNMADLFAEQKRQEVEELKNFKLPLPDVFVAALFVLLFAIVFLQFFTRYALNDSIAWTEEAARYLLICVAFFGTVRCQRLDRHIRLEVVDQVFEKHLGLIKFVGNFLTVGFFVVLGLLVFELSAKTSFQKMVALPFPKYYFYYAILIAISLVVLVGISQLVRAVWGKK